MKKLQILQLFQFISRTLSECYFDIFNPFFDLEFIVYILYSFRADKIYIGVTSDIISRFHSHNALARKGYTTRHRPWYVIYCEVFYSKSEALAREKNLKTAKGRNWIWTKIRNETPFNGAISE